MNEAQQLKVARKVRGTILGLLTRERKKLFDDEGNLKENDIIQMDNTTFTVMLNLVEDHYKRFVQADEKVIRLECQGEEDNDDSEDTDCEISDTAARFYSDYALLKGTLLRFLEQSIPKPETNTTVIQPKPIRLPKLEVPKFSGKYSEWLDFKNEFESMIITNPDLKDIDRFRFLKSSLMEGPKRIISSMEVSEENFAKAWQALKDRYDNISLIFRSHTNELMSIQPVSGSTCERYRELLDAAQAHIRSLLSLGSAINVAENIIICLLLSKLDSKAQAKWEETSTNEIATWDQFAAFLEKYASTLEKVEQTRQQCPRATSTPKKTLSFNKLHTLLASNNSNAGKCLKCKSSDHVLKDCSAFRAMNPHSRYLEVKSLKACLKCLTSHSFRSCKATCGKCKGTHHTLLHFEQQQAVPASNFSFPETSKSRANQSIPINPALMAPGIADNEKALLASVLVFVRNDSDAPIPCHALLDSGSTDNYISERFARTINAKKFKHNRFNEIGGIGGTSTYANGYTNIEFTSQEQEQDFKIRVNILPKITEVYPAVAFEIQDWNIPSNIKLADPHFNKPKRIDLLIGAGLFWSLLRPNRITLGPGLPYIQDTELGWIIAGTAPLYITHQPLNFHVNGDDSLNKLVERFWEIDSVPATTTLSAQDQECERHYISNTCRDSTGRYVVRLPFCAEPNKLGKSIDVAMKRFLNLEHRLAKQPELKQQYSAFINEYETLGHLEVLHDFDSSQPHYFVPHHCVMKLTSSTTKLRVVFDASCKTSSGLSLNDILHTGYQLQDDLFTLLLRFRLFKYVATADIQKMYRQVRVNPPDANFQLILWRENPSDTIKILRLLTVTYGTGPGAYLAIRSLRQLALDEQQKYPIGAQLVLNNFYVDDAMIGGNSEAELQHKIDQLKAILELGGFKLGKFCSNSSEILTKISADLQEKFLRIDEHEIIKALGLMWQPDLDIFRYTWTPNEIKTDATKRIVLSQIAKIFDPLGFICPVVTMAKIFYQSLWKLKIDWDNPLPFHLTEKWKRFSKELNELREVSIQRWALNSTVWKSIQIHGFSDASEKAYGASVYIRCQQLDGSVSVILFCAKSRVAPSKVITIARLELCAAKLLAELIKKLKIQVLNDILIDSTHYWTDSAIVLHWLSAEPHHWSTFIAHRVTRIQKLSKRGEWRHVPGNANPADLISRGLLPSEISQSGLWWHGPEFLVQSNEYWPKDIALPKSFNDIEEARIVKHSFLAVPKDDLTSRMHFSVKFHGTRRAFAYALRFISRCKKPVASKTVRLEAMKNIDYSSINVPSLEEEIVAEEIFIRTIQQSSFHEEYLALSNQRPLCGKSTLIKLSPFIDSKGLLRVGGRLKHAHIPYDTKHQILLPKNHPFTHSLISYFHHERVFHAGPQTTITAVRSRYWPIGALQLTKQVIRNCIWCFRLRPKFSNQLMAPLPAERVKSLDYHPFSVSGVDFAGPISVRHHIRCKQSKEIHLALFICFVTKAVHIELVTDLSTEAFLRALKRFISDRGKITRIYSDNARNFLGASNYLKAVRDMLKSNNSEITQECNKHCISWSFIPPRAPNHGGLWEASIKLLKRLIRNIVGTSNLTEDEMRTVAKHAGSIINSRPLTTLSDDPNDLTPITAGHFIFGGPPTALPEPFLDLSQIENVNKVQLYHRMQYVMQKLWERFYKEYLVLLQPRSKWFFENTSYVSGTLVLLKEQQADPLKWKLGRIINTLPDSNGIVRIVRIKTANGEYDRAINSVAVLPDKFQQC